MIKSLLSTPVLLVIACLVVGVLAAMGKFNSMMNFPWIFALVCLVFGGLALRRERSGRARALRGALLLAGAVVAVGGWLYYVRALEERLQERRIQVLAVLEGQAVPSLAGLEPLNTDQATWDEAASLTAPATIVAFWARWCSPCWKEMAELEELYQQHQDRGLRVLAVTRYDDPDNEEERRSDFDTALAFLESRDHTFPAAITDNDDVYRAYRVPGPPVVALVDDQGDVVDYAISLADARVLMDKAVALVGDNTAGPFDP